MRRVAVVVGTTVALCGVALPGVGQAVAARHAGEPGFALDPTAAFPHAAGRVTLRRVWSPFGVTVGMDGHLIYDAIVMVSGLPAAAPGSAYVAWLATPELDRVRLLGHVTPDTALVARVDWNQFLVIVTLETGRPGTRWAGPMVLQGRSRSSLIRPLWGHSLFRPTPF